MFSLEDSKIEKDKLQESESEAIPTKSQEIIKQRTLVGAKFNIAPSEIEEMVGEDIPDEDMKKILSYIENDEGIWEAIELAKRDAITSILK